MTTAELTKKDIFLETLSTLDFNETEHFLALRKNAMKELESLEFPTSKTEYWKYTRVGKIINNKYELGISKEVDVQPYLIENLDANILVVVNGFYQASLSKIDSESGITITSLSYAKKQELEGVKTHFNQFTQDKSEIFLAINNVYHTDGIYIEVEKNTQSTKPIHIINITTGDNILSQSRNLVVANVGSEVKVIESFINEEGSANFLNHVSEFFVAENAKVEYNKIQDKKENNYSVTTEQVYQEANSNFTINTATFNGALVRNNLNIEVDASNCETNLSGLYLGQNKDHIDNHTVVDHKKPHCNSNEVYKGVLDDESTGVFNGKVYVRQDAQITNAFQQNNNILLTDNASVNSKPELEIYADDVKCSHGSTTGQIDEEAIFYLQSRGISKRGAMKLMINAFAKDALERISIEPLQEYIDQKIEERFA
ncbi:MAG: Fe-S cluster assembly protein SufD [Flavobacteriales bacterium]|nr:Fe-S cluster assembly protein SufD [Flavobacteriales bacterium]MCB9336137.1 Fe-S cluster assembly protein SufD [Flavobacteriales bacterium]